MIDPENAPDIFPLFNELCNALIQKIDEMPEKDPDIIELRKKINKLGCSFQIEHCMRIEFTRQPVPTEEENSATESEAEYNYEEIDDKADEDGEYEEEDDNEEEEDDTPREPISSKFTESDRVRFKALHILLPDDESPK